MHRPKLDPLQALAAVDWLAPAGEAVLHELASHAVPMHFRDGQLIYQYGQDMGHLLVVMSGHIEASMCNTDCKRYVMATVGPGEVAGLIPLMDELGSINDLTARDGANVLLISRQAWLQSLNAHPELATQVIRLLSKRSRQLYQGVTERVLFRLEVRLARLLTALSRTRASNVIAVTQHELAEFLGVTRQSVNQELKRMEQRAWLRTSRSSLELIQPQALKDLSKQ